MDVVVVTSSYPLQEDDAQAAAGLFVRDFARELVRQGHQVRVLTQFRAGPQTPDPGIEVSRFAWRGDRPLSTLNPTRPQDLLAFYTVIRNGRRALSALIRDRKPDLVLALWAVPAGLLASGRSGRPRYRVWTLGSDIWVYGRHPLSKWLVRWVLQGAERIFADGLGLAAETSRIAERECQFLPSSRELPLGQPRPTEIDPARKNLVFIGRFHAHKGVDLLIEAIGLLDPKLRDAARFHFFGGGPLEDAVHQKAIELKLGSSVEFHGYAPPKTAAAFLEHADVAIIPSRIESIPVILSDAARAGCPLLVTDVGDMGQLIRESGAGCVAEPTASSIRDGLLQMWDETRESRAAELSALSQRFALEETVKAHRQTYPGFRRFRPQFPPLGLLSIPFSTDSAAPNRP